MVPPRGMHDGSSLVTLTIWNTRGHQAHIAIGTDIHSTPMIAAVTATNRSVNTVTPTLSATIEVATIVRTIGRGIGLGANNS